jgi:radical SAM protein with 4Fe4S-binding SPASM domain
VIDLARELGARVLNLFFLVRTGCGEGLADISADQYERVLRGLARASGVRQADGRRAPDLLLRAKCAPHFRRIVWELDPASPLLSNYAEGGCPAGRHYCRITPEGEVTPCPYMPVRVGSLRERSFVDLWERADVFRELRAGQLKGRCGACEFRRICGGCRCRAYATHGDYLAEDPACRYQPGAHGGREIALDQERTFGIEVETAMPWDEAARRRLEAIPSFARGMVVKAVEAYARTAGSDVVTTALVADARERWGPRFGSRG